MRTSALVVSAILTVACLCAIGQMTSAEEPKAQAVVADSTATPNASNNYTQPQASYGTTTYPAATTQNGYIQHGTTTNTYGATQPAPAKAATVIKVFRLKYAPATDVALAINESIRSDSAKDRPTIVPDAISNSMIISGTKETIEKTAEIIARLDMMPQQICVKIKLIELNLGDEKPGVLQRMIVEKQKSVDKPLSNAELAETIDTTIDDLKGAGMLKLLAAPQIMTLDNQPAFIQIGQRVRVKEQMENVGLISAITPRINEKGDIVAEIDLEKSSYNPDTDAIDVTTVQTTVQFESGKPTMIGACEKTDDDGSAEILMIATAVIVSPKKDE